LYEYHDASIEGHQGIARTLSRIRLEHNWRGITRDVEEYISKCEYCQKNKLSRKKCFNNHGYANETIREIRPGYSWSLNRNDKRKQIILTFQDNLTKLSKAIPLTNQEVATVAKKFVTKIVFEHGMPEKILTDQGRNSTREMFKNTCKLLKIEKIQIRISSKIQRNVGTIS